jgi:biotin carboxyl carrier protein
MPADRKPGSGAAADPATDQRALRDHKAIARLADDLLPALIAKLGASGLGEIEVREGDWKARLRKSAGADAARLVAARGAAEALANQSLASGRGGSGRADRGTADDERRPGGADAELEPNRAAATSPAVGIYHPRRGLTVGMRVTAGDRIGAVDILGVRQDVVAPVDGIIGASLAEAGEAVEYGQELVRIELPQGGLGLASDLGDLETAGVTEDA